jgi:subtilisin
MVKFVHLGAFLGVCFWWSLGGIVAGQQSLVPVLVRFHAQPNQVDAERISLRGGVVTRQFQVVPAFAARVPAAALAGLRAAPGVAAVELDLEVAAHDYGNVWGTVRVGAPEVHNGAWVGSGELPRPIEGRGVRVAVLDTGIDYRHPDLLHAYRGGYDFVNNDNDPLDDQWHGTHVAGTIAAGVNGFGAAGVAPGVDLYALKVLSSTGSGNYSAIISAIDWSINNNIQVLNLSLGSSGDPGSTVRQAFDRAQAAGLVVVASAGNAGSGADTVSFPAKYESVIAVASTTSTDARSSFSSTGPAVELAAPGSSIYSTYPGGGYATANGTSMAAPHIAGIAALLLEAGVADFNGDGLVNDDLRVIMQATATDLGSAGRDDWFGHGLANAPLAVWFSANQGDGPPPPPPTFDPPSNLTGTALGSTVSLTWQDNSSDEDGFQLTYGSGKGRSFSWQPPVGIPADTTSWTLSLPDETYRFRIRAVRGAEVTDWSNEISLKVSGSSGGGGGGGKGGGKK